MSKWDDVEERERGKAEFWNTSTLSLSLSLYISLYLSQYPHSKTGCTALDMPEWREITDHKDWRAKQPSQVWLEEDLKCWGAWDTTCRHKAEDIIPLIAWCEKRKHQSSLKWQEGAIVTQMNIGTVSKTTLGKLPRDGMECIELNSLSHCTV